MKAPFINITFSKRLVLLFLFFICSLQSIKAQQIPGFIPYRQGNKWGFCDSTKKIIVSCVYDSVSNIYSLPLTCYSSKQFSKKEYAQGVAYEQLVETTKCLPSILAYKNGEITRYFSDGTIAYKTPPAKRRENSSFSGSPNRDKFPISDKSAGAGYKIKQNEILEKRKKCIYEKTTNTGVEFIFNNGDSKKQEVFDFMQIINDSLIIVGKAKKRGLIDAFNQKIVLPIIYDSIYTLNSKNDIPLGVKLNNLTGIWAKNKLSPIKYSHVKILFSSEAGESIKKVNTCCTAYIVYFTVSEKGKTGLCNYDGIEIIPPKYNSVQVFSHYLFGGEENGKWDFYGEDYKPLLSAQFDVVKYSPSRILFNKKLTIVSNEQKWGLIDSAGQIIIPIKYDNITGLDCALLEVQLKGKKTFIDYKGTEYFE